MHTIKGVASMYGFDYVSVITHHLETVFDLIRENKLKVTPEIIDISFQTSDIIKSIFEDQQLSNQTTKKSYDSIIEHINKLAEIKELKLNTTPVKKQETNQNSKISTFNIIFYPKDNLLKRNINIIRTFRDLFALGEYYIYKPNISQDRDYWSFFIITDKNIENIEEALFFILDDCIIKKIANYNLFDKTSQNFTQSDIKNTIENISIENLKKKEHITITKQKIISDDKNTDKIVEPEICYNPDLNVDISKNITSRITIESSKLDTLMYLVSELITTNSQLILSTKSTKYDELRPYLEKIDTLSKNFRNNALDIRLVPLNDMVVRFKRLIRDISHNLGKEIDFETQGTETELDKSTIDILGEPIMHLIRNGIDHGIESPEERISKGKKPKGIIKITAYNSGNYIFIQIQDDGKGIDTKEIKRKAIEKGFITDDKELTKKEILDIIFLPGFSTAQNLTQVSGRGVGMDIVRKKISEVRGEISIDTELNLGTSFTIKLSQSIAILDTMLIECSNNYFMVPIYDVVVCERVEKNLIINHNTTHTIPYGDFLIPFIDLRDIFELSKEYPAKIKTIILKRQDKYLAIITDKIIGAHQAVLKSLGHTFKNHQLISSGSLLGDGNIAYLLDTMQLFKNK
jgi:two-component system chemotaxis sensor kinase CheA